MPQGKRGFQQEITMKEVSLWFWHVPHIRLLQSMQGCVSLFCFAFVSSSGQKHITFSPGAFPWNSFVAQPYCQGASMWTACSRDHRLDSLKHHLLCTFCCAVPGQREVSLEGLPPNQLPSASFQDASKSRECPFILGLPETPLGWFLMFKLAKQFPLAT